MDRERKIPASYNYYKSSNKTPETNKRRESPYSISDQRFKKGRFSSPEKQGEVKNTSSEVINIAEEINNDIPDRSFGDFYCRACNSHMSSEQIWESHVQGKRHSKTTKKKSSESEYEFVEQDPIMLPEIKKVQKPIIGLQHCCELQRSDGKLVYQCFLCSTSIPNSKLLIEHVIGMKHRMAYLKIHDSVNYNVIMKAELKKGMAEPLVEEFIQKYQEKHGLGKMRVKVSKLTSSFNNPTRPYEDDLIHKKDRNVSKNLYDDDDEEEDGSSSDSSDWRHSRNSYDDDDDDVRNESRKKSPDWRHSRKSYGDNLRKHSPSKNFDLRHRRDFYDVRKESKSEESNWRQISTKERDYHRNDKHGSESQYEKSIRQQKHFEKNEISSSERQFSTPPLNSKVNYEENERDLYANSSWKIPSQNIKHQEDQAQYKDLRDLIEKKPQEDLRDVLQKKRMLETSAKTVLKSTNACEFVLSIIEDLPNMKFLEIVLNKVQKMKDPSESELNMLSKIGKCMFSIVMEKKMNMLTPDLRKKYQSVTNENVSQSSATVTPPEQQSTNKFDFQSLLNLIKNPKQEKEKPTANQNFPPPNLSAQFVAGHHPLAYTTGTLNNIPNLWQTPSSLPSSSKDFSPIPGLSLSGSQGVSSNSLYSYSQVPSHEQYTSAHNAWSTTQRQFK